MLKPVFYDLNENVIYLLNDLEFISNYSNKLNIHFSSLIHFPFFDNIINECIASISVDIVSQLNWFDGIANSCPYLLSELVNQKRPTIMQGSGQLTFEAIDNSFFKE